MSSSGVIGGQQYDTLLPDQIEGDERFVHLGVFFDGTNNNKYQVAMGKYFRKKKSNSSRTEKDRQLFGYSENDDSFFVEETNHSAELYQKKEDIDKNTKEGIELYNQITDAYKKNDLNSIKDGEGAAAQDVDTYTNVAILDSLYNDHNDECNTIHDYYSIYVEGAGTDMDLTDNSTVLTWRTEGLATGTGKYGVEKKVDKAIKAIRNICNRYAGVKNVHLLISTYGFSRGATEARMFSWQTKKENKKLFLTDSIANKITTVKLEFVGLFDTVSSVGIPSNHKKNVVDLHLWGITEANSVLHLCAQDEFRDNFALTDIDNCIATVGTEFFMPGCHTDVGGGLSIGLEKGCRKITCEKDIELMQDGIYGSSVISKSQECFYIKEWDPQSKNVIIGANSFDIMGWIDKKTFFNKIDGKSDDDVEKAGGAYQENSSRSTTPHLSYIEYRTSKDIEIRKYSLPGYSNIALNLMHIKARKIFKAVPIAYQVPSDSNNVLRKCYNRWKEQINSKGRIIANTENALYRELRNKYLHISFTEAYTGGSSITDNKIVNGPTRKQIIGTDDYLITRLVYKGVKNGGSTYMDELTYDYQCKK